MTFDLNGKRYELKDLGNKFDIKLIKELGEEDKLPSQEIDGHTVYKYIDEYGKERIGIKKNDGKGSYIILILNIFFIFLCFVYIFKIIAIINK